MQVTSTYRNATRVFTAPRATDGDGVELRRAFPGAALTDLDPFLLLDQMGPMEMAPGAARGFPPHPHRGFETVTYLLSGQFEHRDSWGNHGILRPGDVQWMTAGSGLVHSELPGPELVRNGGRLLGFQLWVNLPRKDKMAPPRYQDTAGERIPMIRNAEGTVSVKIVAGESMGTKGIIETRIPILYLDVTLAPGAGFEQPLPKHWNVFAYVVEGQGQFGGAPAEQSQMAIFDRGGDAFQVVNDSRADLRFLLIGGEPIGEPVVRYGPFVMNSKQEILEAVEDFRSGRMGTLE